jgi:hypothetical protein
MTLITTLGLYAVGIALCVLNALMFVTCWRQIMTNEKSSQSRILWILVTLAFIPTPIGVVIYMAYTTRKHILSEL